MTDSTERGAGGARKRSDAAKPGGADPDSLLTGALRARGHRVTPQRLLIHRALRELDRHASAEEVMRAVSDRLPNASLPTVYATLELLDELGIVRRVRAGDGPALFDPRTGEHHHLVCERCGSVADLDASLDASAALAAARREGFAPRRSEVVISGLCSRCASSALRAGPAPG